MNKRLVSLLLVIVMICTLLPMTVLAADTQNSDSETGTIAVVVYGKGLTKILDQKTLAAVKAGIISVLAAEPIPEVTFSLKKDGAPIKADFQIAEGSFMKSVNYDFGSSISLIEKLGEFGLSVADKITPYLGIDALTKYTKDAYRVYKAEVPAGEYELDIAAIAGDGYIVNEETMAARPFTAIKVEAGETTYVGFEKTISAESFDLTDLIEESANTIIDRLPVGIRDIVKSLHDSGAKITDKLIELAISGASKYFDFQINFPGVWLAAKDPGFSFTSVNFAGEKVPGATFVMVNRDEMEKILRASIQAGKETFENAMAILGDDEGAVSWDDINLLNKQILTWDTTANEIAFDQETAYQVLKAYLTLAYQSALPAAQNFMSKETNIRLPAILKETADEDGIVHFTEDSNVTLVWAIDIIRSLMKKAVELGQEGTSELSEMLTENEEAAKLKAIVDITNEMLKIFASDKVQDFEEKGAEFLKKEINTWVYPLLMNDRIPEKLHDLAEALTKIKVNGQFVDTEKLQDLVGLMPDHALLTAKMPAGYYLMFELSAPEGYLRSPVFYTVNVKWDTTGPIDEWLYVNVANIGILGPYFAEDYYTFLRNNSLIKTGDTIISKLTGKESDVLARTITDTTLVPTTIAYFAGLVYNNMGGSAVYDSQEALVTDLSKYLLSHGVNAQNLWIFANQVKDRAEAVVTSEITEDWYFYNIKENLHTNFADAAKAILNGKKAALTEENLVSSAVTSIIDAKISAIDKVDTAITNATAKYVAAVKEATSSATKSIVSKAASTVKSLLSRLFKR